MMTFVFLCRRMFGRSFLLLACLLVGPDPAWAQAGTTEAPGSGASRAFECTDVSVDYANDPNLTREERIRLMDQALFDSLGKFDSCQAERAAAAAAGGGAGGADATAEAGESVASSDMAGEASANSEAEESTSLPDRNDENQHAKWSNPDQGEKPLNPEFLDESDAQKDQEQNGDEAGDIRLKNGKIPDDIPPADNDSVLEAQIRRAAIDEKDPETKARLWNEYRKYKGLPVVKAEKTGGEG